MNSNCILLTDKQSNKVYTSIAYRFDTEHSLNFYRCVIIIVTDVTSARPNIFTGCSTYLRVSTENIIMDLWTFTTYWCHIWSVHRLIYSYYRTLQLSSMVTATRVSKARSTCIVINTIISAPVLVMTEKKYRVKEYHFSQY